MQDEILQPVPSEYAEATSHASGGSLPANQVIKPTARAIAGAILTITLQALPLVIGVALVTKISFPISADTILFLLTPVILMVLVGSVGLYRLADFLLFHRYRGELHFDGSTVISKVPGAAPQSFTRGEVLAYYPHRNEVLLIDGRTIPLPTCETFLYYHQPAMATRWLNAWWPEMDLTKAISTAEETQGWIRFTPHGVQIPALAAVFYIASSQLAINGALIYAILILQMYVPNWLEGRLRRNVMITIGSGTDAPTST